MKMKKLMTASVLVIGLGLSSAAIANDQNQNNDAGNCSPSAPMAQI
jgi:hypothetical protein